MVSFTVLLSTENAALAKELARQAMLVGVELSRPQPKDLFAAARRPGIGAVIVDGQQTTDARMVVLRLRLDPTAVPLVVISDAGDALMKKFCDEQAVAHLEMKPVSPGLLARVRGMFDRNASALRPGTLPLRLATLPRR